MTNNLIKTPPKNEERNSAYADGSDLNHGSSITRLEDWDYMGSVNRGESPIVVNGEYRRSPGNQPSYYAVLSEVEQDALQEWISLVFRAAKTSPGDESYAIKHDYEAATGLYVGNGAFKGAMLVAGYQPVDWTELNWTFRARATKRPRYTKRGRMGNPKIRYYDLPNDPEGVAELMTLVERVKGKVAR